ncbi:hypothetical protein T484DRAFT_1931603 [Baffinella frigidus]|jgi:tetratricopeptide (TPR) repeat protein|nr:hypothetical protein T484DRAFT_1931603 [Cryptophyta sp. CCMP2293]|mmetsp:Transcript_42807/g.101699  ORF Transcript_42807/g.101699 Transcript_42807/m.101699 type:complete len:195 (+) Transcript_42807:23-607(+)
MSKAAKAEELKAKGNDAFKGKRYRDAVDFYTRAISAGGLLNHVLFSNRCACFVALEEYDSALIDANKCVALKPDWGKGYGRQGEVHLAKGDLDKAEAAYKKGLTVEPALGLLATGVAEVTKAQELKKAQALANLAAWQAKKDAPQKPAVPKRKHVPEEPAESSPAKSGPTSRAQKLCQDAVNKKRPMKAGGGLW